jgi:hypothetical protein
VGLIEGWEAKMQLRLSLAILLALVSPALAQPNLDDICEAPPANTPKDVLAFQQRRITCDYSKDTGNTQELIRLRCAALKQDEAKLRHQYARNAAALRYLRETADCIP